jgi:serine/threonine protein kinase
MVASADPSWTFQPLFELGRGGVAVVRAERVIDEVGQARVLAVKRLLPMVASSDEARTMFLDEARLASLVDHPNVVRIFAHGQQDEPFIAMELVLGETLASLIGRAAARQQPPFEPRLALHVCAEVCDALHAAHELRHPDTGAPLELVHRDVSPQNVLIGFDGDVRLTDFGIAKALGYGARTRTGDVKGKVPYMSPEQAVGDPVDRRSDMFALGAVLFECLSGRRMLGEGNEIDMLRKLAMESFPDLREAWGDAPERARELFARLVHRDPAGRLAPASELAEGLRAIAEDRDRDGFRRSLSARVEDLARGRREALESKLHLGQQEARRQEPYLEEIEAFQDRPSMLFRERRRARAMLLLGLAFLVGAVAFVVAFSRSPRVAPTAPSAAVVLLPSVPSVTPSESLPGAAPAPPTASSLPSATSPPPRATRPPKERDDKPPIRHDDGLDETPF